MMCSKRVSSFRLLYRRPSLLVVGLPWRWASLPIRLTTSALHSRVLVKTSINVHLQYRQAFCSSQTNTCDRTLESETTPASGCSADQQLIIFSRATVGEPEVTLRCVID